MRIRRLWQIVGLFRQRRCREIRRQASRFVEGLEDRTMLSSPSMVADLTGEPAVASLVTAATDEPSGFQRPAALILIPTPTAISLAFAPEWKLPGCNTAFKAIVTANGASPSGSFEVRDENHVLATFAIAPLQIFGLALPPGPHTLTAHFIGNESFAESVSQSLFIDIPGVETTTTLQISAPSAGFGEQVTLTASVASGDPAELWPQGQVRFIDVESNAAVGAGRLYAGSTSLIMQSPAVGTHTFVAEFVDDSSNRYEGSLSQSVTLTVSAMNTTTILASAQSSAFGGINVLRATVSSPNGTIPDGNVTFVDGKTTLGTATLNNGFAELPVSGLASGRHVFTATYSGSANFIASVSAAAAHSVLSNSAVRLSVSTKYTTAGQPVTLTAALSPRASRKLASSDKRKLVPSGRVYFYSDSVLLGRGRVVKNSAKLTTKRLSPGWHTITASYSGDTHFVPSASSAVATVIAYPTIVDLMVIYTPAALASVGGPYMMNQTIRQAVRDTNQAFINSQIPVTLRVVRAALVQYTESGDYDTDLTRLRWPRDGYLDDVPALRNKCGADLVTLFAAPPNNDTLGIGYQLLDTATRDNDARGYSVVEAQCAAAPDYVLAHELGHNFGASHDIEQDDSQGAPADSHGYRFFADGTLYHDIMSYDPGATIPYFSNPTVYYLGVPTGTAAYANSARVITADASYIAGYRPTKLSLESTVMLLN